MVYSIFIGIITCNLCLTSSKAKGFASFGYVGLIDIHRVRAVARSTNLHGTRTQNKKIKFLIKYSHNLAAILAAFGRRFHWIE